MSRFRIRLKYSQGDLGGSELYWTSDVDITNVPAANALAKRLTDFLAARASCMFTNQLITGVSIGVEGVRRSSFVARPGTIPWPTQAQVLTIPAAGTLSITAVTRRPEQLKVALQMQLRFANTKYSNRYFSTVPDSVTSYDPNGVVYDADNIWWQRWKDWRSKLIGDPWFLKNKLQTGEALAIHVSGVVQQAAAPSLVGFLLPTGTVPGDWDRGTVLDLSGFRMASCPCPTINGRWTIDSINTTLTPGFATIFLANSAAIDPSLIKIQGFAQKVVMEFSAIQAANLIRATTHNRGNAGLRRVGRRKARCCKV